MVRVKFFCSEFNEMFRWKDKENFTNLEVIPEREKEINEWFKQLGNATVLKIINHRSSGDMIIVSIWYDDGMLSEKN